MFRSGLENVSAGNNTRQIAKLTYPRVFAFREKFRCMPLLWTSAQMAQAAENCSKRQKRRLFTHRSYECSTACREKGSGDHGHRQSWAEARQGNFNQGRSVAMHE